MAKGKRIGLVIAVDGEKEFKQQVTSINKSITAMKSELNMVSAEYANNANSLEALTKKHEIQNRICEESKKKADKVSDALNNSKKNYEKVGKAIEDLKKDFQQQNAALDQAQRAYDDAKASLEKMTKEGKSSEQEIRKQSQEVSRLEKALEQQKKAADDSNTKLAEAQTAYRKCGGRIKDWETKLNNANAQTRKAEVELKQYADYMAEAEQSADHCAESIDEFGKAVDKTSQFKIGVKEGLLAGFGETIAEKGLDAVGEVVDAVKDSMVDLSSASADLAAKTGLSEEAMRKYKDVMTEIKGDNFGESYGDVSDVMAQIVQIMGELDPSAMKETTEAAITLRDTFDMDVNETLRAVDVMVTTMGVDAQTAFDLIAKGAQNGLDRSHELTDNITEYGQLWAQMGFSAEEMFSILENGLDSGAYNLDKVNDYVKEFGVSLADGRIEKNLDKFSKGTKSLFQQWKDGKVSSRDVFYSVINDLSEMTNQQEALTVASEVWSALGEDNAMQVITALDDVNTAYSNVQGTMDKLKETKYSDLESAVSQFGASVQENILTPIAEKAIPAITGAVNLATGAIEGVGNLINPAKSEFETFIDDVETANNDLSTAIKNADTAKENALAEGEKIEYLGERLIALNGIESKSAAQRLEMDGIVQQLGEHIPQIAEAYDKEAGKVQLADGEIRNLITSTKELMVTQALQAQAQEVVNKLVEAQIQYDKASDRFGNLSELRSALQELQDEYTDLFNKQQEGLIDNEAFDAAESSIRERAKNLNGIIQETLGEGVTAFDDWSEMGPIFAEAFATIDGESSDLSDTMAELEASIADGNTALEDMNGVAEEVAGSLGAVKDGEKKAGDAAGDTADATEESAEIIAGAFDLAKDTVEEYGGKAVDWLVEVGETAKKVAEEDIAKAAEAGAEAQKNALQDVLDTYHGYVSEIEADLQSKINPFEKFDTETGFGEDVTVEKMTENLNSQAEAFEAYQKKLAAVKEHVGKEIAPEFMKYIEDMGIEGTNTLDHILRTFEDDEPEKVRALSDAWCNNMDMTEDMAKAGAANQIAFEAAMGELGSTPVEFTGLQDSIKKATQDASGMWGVMSTETEASLNAAVQTARDCGIKIPEGLSEGIASGEISPTQAIAQLNGALQGSINGMVGVAREAGLEIPASITAGIESGDSEAMKTAYDKLISYIADNADTAALTEIMDKAGEDSTDALGGHADDAKTEGENVAQAGADGAAGKKSEYKTAGEGNIDEYVAALSAGKSRAAQAAGETAQEGYTAAGEYDSEFHDVGYNMSAGIAGGINDGGKLIANAMKGQVRSALAAGKNEAEIKSPSRKFRREIGQQIGNGVAFGIRDKASLAGKEAAKMSAQVYSKAAAWMAKYKKSHEVSLNDEKYYWDQVLQHVKKGTTAYNNAVKKLATATFSGTDLSNSASSAAMKKIESNFGVSRTKTTGSGKSKKTTKKDAEVYYSEIYNAANKYLSNMQTLNDWSLQAELKYWKAVQAQLKKGTQAWYDAQRQINSAKDGIAEAQREAAEAEAEAQAEAAEAAEKAVEARVEANNQIVSDAEDYIRKQKILNKMSTQQELAYWKEIIRTVDEGSDAWYDALEHIGDLTEQVKQEMEDAAKAAKEAAEAQKEAFEEAKKAIEAEQDAAKERIRTTANVQSQILSKYKTYYKVSAKAEMEYWDIARRQFQEGTDERIEADQRYFDARESYYEQLADLDEEYAEKKKDIDDELADSIKSLQDAYDDAVSSRKREILSSFNLFEAWDAEGYNKDKLLENLRTQVNGVNFWADQLEELGKKGVTQELLDELAAMGPDAAANLWSLNQMTSEELDEYIRLWEEKNRIAQEQARLDNEELYKKTQDGIAEARKKAQEEINIAKAEYDKAVSDLNAGLTDGLKDLVTQAGTIGEDMVSALVESVRRGVGSVSDEIARLKREAEEAQKLTDQAAEARAAEEEARRKAEEEAARRAAEEEAARRAAEEEAKRKAEEEAKRKAEEEAARRAAEEAAAKRAAEEAARKKAEEEAAKRAAEEAKKKADSVQSASAPQKLQGFTASSGSTSGTVSSSSKSSASATVNGADNILKIIQSGTKRSKKITAAEKKEHVALWEYIVENYGYAPGNSVYKKLADALGVNADKTVTSDQKEKILKALKKKGYASGTRAVWEDELAWILENARTEYLVRKSDQAILQPMRAGDKVISPKGAENVYNFANNPGTFLQPYMRTALEQARVEMARENEVLRRQMETLDRTGMGRLNRLMEQGTQQAPVVNVDNGGVLSMMGTLASALNRLVELAESGQQVVLDTGALVGAIQQPMSQANASATVRRNRGRSGQ